MVRTRYFILFFLAMLGTVAYSQTNYPKLTGYFSVVHPIVTFSKDGTTTNFKDNYVVGFPIGVNIWKNPAIGFSFELTPYITSANGTSKMNNLLFHPGVLFALGHGYTFVSRLAFETSGRYGVTPIINKTIKKSKSCSYYISIPFPVRFGNDKPTTATIGFQLGIAF